MKAGRYFLSWLPDKYLTRTNIKRVPSFQFSFLFLQTQAETDYAKAHADVTRKLKIVEETIQVFEEQKIKDLKTTLLILIKGEIRAHAKALEMLTQGYRSIEDVSEQEDLQVRDMVQEVIES